MNALQWNLYLNNINNYKIAPKRTQKLPVEMLFYFS
jgi:hypothetical protein